MAKARHITYAAWREPEHYSPVCRATVPESWRAQFQLPGSPCFSTTDDDSEAQVVESAEACIRAAGCVPVRVRL